MDYFLTNANSRAGSEGSRRLIRGAAEKGGQGAKGVEWTPEMRERKRRIAVEQNLARHIKPGCNLGPWWTDEETALLGKEPDEEVARRTGRSPEAVRAKREALGIPNAFARQGAYGSPPWTEQDDEVLRRLPPQEAALRTGRTIDAVYSRRGALGITSGRR